LGRIQPGVGKKKTLPGGSHGEEKNPIWIWEVLKREKRTLENEKRQGKIQIAGKKKKKTPRNKTLRREI